MCVWKRDQRLRQWQVYCSKPLFTVEVKSLGLCSGFAQTWKKLGEMGNCLVLRSNEREYGGQFHQRSTRSFYGRKFSTQLFCAYIYGLYFTGARLLAQNLSVERWWNWPWVYEESERGLFGCSSMALPSRQAQNKEWMIGKKIELKQVSCLRQDIASQMLIVRMRTQTKQYFIDNEL